MLFFVFLHLTRSLCDRTLSRWLRCVGIRNAKCGVELGLCCRRCLLGVCCACVCACVYLHWIKWKWKWMRSDVLCFNASNEESAHRVWPVVWVRVDTKHNCTFVDRSYAASRMVSIRFSSTSTNESQKYIINERVCCVSGWVRAEDVRTTAERAANEWNWSIEVITQIRTH